MPTFDEGKDRDINSPQTSSIIDAEVVEVVDLYNAPPLPESHFASVPCQGPTQKGVPCPYPSIPGTKYCARHTKESTRALDTFKQQSLGKRAISSILLNTRKYLKSQAPEDIKGEIANMRSYRDFVQEIVTRQHMEEDIPGVDMELVAFVNKLNAGIIQAVQTYHHIEYARNNLITQNDLNNIIDVLINIAKRNISDEQEFISFAEEVRSFLLGVSTGRSHRENEVA